MYIEIIGAGYRQCGRLEKEQKSENTEIFAGVLPDDSKAFCEMDIPAPL